MIYDKIRNYYWPKEDDYPHMSANRFDTFMNKRNKRVYFHIGLILLFFNVCYAGKLIADKNGLDFWSDIAPFILIACTIILMIIMLARGS